MRANFRKVTIESRDEKDAQRILRKHGCVPVYENGKLIGVQPLDSAEKEIVDERGR